MERKFMLEFRNKEATSPMVSVLSECLKLRDTACLQ